MAGERKLISIDQIRDRVAEAQLRPYEGRSKVFVIDPADGLSVSGSNSLLKTLEEPTRDAFDAIAGSFAADDPVAIAGNLRRRRSAAR